MPRRLRFSIKPILTITALTFFAIFTARGQDNIAGSIFGATKTEAKSNAKTAPVIKLDKSIMIDQSGTVIEATHTDGHKETYDLSTIKLPDGRTYKDVLKASSFTIQRYDNEQFGISTVIFFPVGGKGAFHINLHAKNGSKYTIGIFDVNSKVVPQYNNFNEWMLLVSEDGHYSLFSCLALQGEEGILNNITSSNTKLTTPTGKVIYDKNGSLFFKVMQGEVKPDYIAIPEATSKSLSSN